MSINSVQLISLRLLRSASSGLTMTEFVDRYGDEAKCYRAPYKWRRPKGFRCPDATDGRVRG